MGYYSIDNLNSLINSLNKYKEQIASVEDLQLNCNRLEELTIELKKIWKTSVSEQEIAKLNDIIDMLKRNLTLVSLISDLNSASITYEKQSHITYS